MITNQRRYEIVKACDGLINSPNISVIGKLFAKAKREKIIAELILFDSTKTKGE